MTGATEAVYDAMIGLKLRSAFLGVDGGWTAD
jgi:hypothetical protein